MQKTVLYDNHVKSNGKLVEFAGYMLPINYGSQIEEHNSVRTAAGMFDVSHMTVYDITGPDTDKFLSYLLSNDVAKLPIAKAFYSLYLDKNAGIIDDLIVYHRGKNSYRIVSNAGTRDKDLAWVASVAVKYDVAVTSYNHYAIIALQGPQSLAILSKVLPTVAAKLASLDNFYFVEELGCFIARTGYTGELGFEIIVMDAVIAGSLWDALVENGVKPCGLGARDTLRLEAGMNLYGQDMDESINPAQNNTMFAVDVKTTPDRDFIGKSAYLAARVNNTQVQVGLILIGKGVLRHGYKLMCDGNIIGVITSGSFAPSMGVSIAMARIDTNYLQHSNINVDIRGVLHGVKLVKLPFVKQGKILVDL